MARYDTSTDAPTPGVGTTTAELFSIAKNALMVGLRVGMPATVVSWSPPVAAGVKSKPAMVDVQPDFISVISINTKDELTADELANGWVLGEENGGYTKSRKLPIIRNRPVHYPGSQDMMLRGPLKPGATGWIKFADRSLDKWIQCGGPVEPGHHHFHELTDAIFEPGLLHGKNSLPIEDGVWTLGPNDNTAGLDIETETRDVSLRTTGAVVTIESATSIKVGAAAVLAAMRTTDPINPGSPMIAWALTVETAINVLIPGTFTPANSFATTVATANSGNFGTCGTGSGKVTIE